MRDAPSVLGVGDESRAQLAYVIPPPVARRQSAAAGFVARVLVTSNNPSSESLATLGIFALEVALLTWLTQASFGQRLVGIRVVGRSRRLNLVAVVLRTVLIAVLAAGLAAGIFFGVRDLGTVDAD